MKSVLLIGCGDIACRFARQVQTLQKEQRQSSELTQRATADLTDVELFGLKRTLDDSLPENIQLIQADLLQPETLKPLAEHHFDYAIATLSPSQFNEQAYRNIYVQGLKNILQVLNLQQRFFWVSSSSVYGQLDGQWVDEASDTSPTAFSGRIQLEAEQVIKNSGLPHTIVRFAGIYGPGRNRLIERVRTGKLDKGEKWSNRIHVEDCAAVLVHLMQLAEAKNGSQVSEPSMASADVFQTADTSQGHEISDINNSETTMVPVLHELYLAVDDLPCQLKDVYGYIADQLQIKLELSGEATKSRAGSKRCSNERLKSTGFTFRYPDFKHGYRDILADYLLK